MDELTEEVRAHREPGYDVTPLLVNRWSPRAMTGEPLDDDALMALFEAARWAPSGGNRQPWRFRYAARDSPDWDDFFGLLSDGNQKWCADAAALVLVLSRREDDDGDPIRNASFSTGAAWENLALEGTRRGLVVHPMAGFDRDSARDVLGVPDALRVEIMTAIGHRGSRDSLSEYNQGREYPNGRKPLDDLVGAGGFE